MFFINEKYKQAFANIGLTDMDSFFEFDAGNRLDKANMAEFRTRIEFQADGKTFYLKRYENPPVIFQLKNWLTKRRKISAASCDIDPAEILRKNSIGTAETVAAGDCWGGLFEKRSFAVTAGLPGGSLEKKMPAFGTKKEKDRFISSLAGFVRKFHDTQLRHRDLYLCHIFTDPAGKFYLIDLARVFKPARIFSHRYRVKDITQLYYSAPAEGFSKTQRLRFYMEYAGTKKISPKDKAFIARVKKRAEKMAQHDTRHDRAVPYKGI